MEQVFENKRDCCGCGACAHRCPDGAIAMEPDEEGFLYPVIRAERCMDCGLCQTICPFRKEDHWKNEQMPQFYVAKHRDGEVLRRSTSGGAFTALSDQVLDMGGAVYGAVFDSRFRVVHQRATGRAGRDRMRFSKYVQSDLGNCFCQVEQDLRQGKPVLFTGTPCQNAGLRAAMGPLAEQGPLVCCDLICYGVPSPRVWEAYKQLLEKEQGAPLAEVSFRTKELPWSRSNSNRSLRYRTANQREGQADQRFYRLFFESGAILRPSCGQCPFASACRASDLTIADYWGIEKYAPEEYDPLGVSLVLTSTERGRRLLEQCPSLWTEARPAEESLAEQKRLHQPAELPENRPLFWDTLEKEGLEAACNAVLDPLE